MSDNLKDTENSVRENDVQSQKAITETLVNTEALLLKNSIKSKITLTRVFAVLGSLLAAIGVGLLVFELWKEFPGVMRTLIALLPMLLGQVISVYTYLKKRENVAWCEGASIALTVGVTATVGLTSMANNLYLGVCTCILIDSVLILPIISVFNAVSVLPIFYGYAIVGSFAFSINSFKQINILFTVVSMIVLIVFGAISVHFMRNELSEKRYEISVWITAISVFSAIAAISPVLFEYFGFVFPVILLLGYFVGMYAYSDVEKPWSVSFKKIGAVLSLITALSLACWALSSIYPYDYLYENVFEELFANYKFVRASVICGIGGVLFIGVGIVFNEKSFFENKMKMIYSLLSTLLIISTVICLTVERLINLFAVIIFLIAFIMGLIFILRGVKERNYYTLNFGIISEFILVYFVLTNIVITTLIVAILLILSGAILLGSNYFISKQIKTEEKMLSEVTLDEE